MSTIEINNADERRLRVLVVDDSAVFRKVILEILAELSFVEVVGTAPNGAIALDKCAALHPDAITLDVEMPTLDGLSALRRLRVEHPTIDAIMVSALTRSGADVTLEALELGAVDFVTKESLDSAWENKQNLKGQLKKILSMLHRRCHSAAEQARKPAPESPTPSRFVQPSPRIDLAARVEVVAIAVSTGGPKALSQLLPTLPADFPVPVLIVQHMPATFTRSLAECIDAKAAVKVVEAQDGDLPEAGTVYIAPGGKQMKIDGTYGTALVLRINDDPPEKHCRPSADYLLRSVAKVYQGRALGVILTGMGDDGVMGLRLLKRHKAPIIAQDEATCVVYGMPHEAVKAGVVDMVLPLHKIGAEIIRLCSFLRR
ncbi:MAG: chemotaxis response regulator protein-glutamate methylesterase [Myxococcota bacterium]|jgi:two-component system chemotaxis response regulator CheB|nr:chemotaxis response regulator protein-glutamate methylesterase [Myxococcota bacterium]